MAASTAFEQRKLTRKLDRLSRLYEKDLAYVREYHQTLTDIRTLLFHESIDLADAQDMQALAEKKFSEEKLKHDQAKAAEKQAAQEKTIFPFVYLFLLAWMAGIIYLVVTW